MKPATTNSLSAWGYIGLLILFNLPYIGTPATILCALFAPNRSAKGFARAILIIELIAIALLVGLALLGLFNFSDILEQFMVDFPGDEGVAILTGARSYICF